MLAVHYLDTLEGVVLPAKPSQQYMDDWGKAVEKAVENRGSRDLKVDNYLAKCNYFERKYKNLRELAIDDSVEVGSNANVLSGDYASFMAYQKGNQTLVDSLSSLELSDLIVEFLEVQQDTLEEGIWLYALLDNAIRNATNKNNSAKVTAKLAEKIKELNVTELVQDIVMTEGALAEISNYHNGGIGKTEGLEVTLNEIPLEQIA